MGHMNVASYVAKFDEATWQLFAAIGLTPSRLRSENLGVPAVERPRGSERGLFPGDVIALSSAVLEIRDKAIRFPHEMTSSETGEPAARMVVVAVHLDRATRKARSFPADVRDRVRAMREG